MVEYILQKIKLIFIESTKMEQKNTTLTNEEKLKQKAEKLKKQLEQTKNKIAQIQAKSKANERKNRNRKLFNVGGLFSMVDDSLLEVENDSTMMRLILGTAIQLNELLNAKDENSNIRLATLEQKARVFLNTKEQAKLSESAK